MKRSNFSFKSLTIILFFIIIGFFQLGASQSQVSGNSFKVPVTIFSSAYKHIQGLEKDADRIIHTVRQEFNLDDRAINYHRVTIDVIDEDNDAEGDFLFVYFLLKERYTFEISKITLLENYKILGIENDYKLKQGESSTEWLDSESCDCPDTSIEVLLSTCETGIPTAVAAINYSYSAAVNAGYNAKKLLGSEENTTDIDKWLCCPNLKYWGRIGHGFSGGILLYDGILSYSYFDSLDEGALECKLLYFNSCQVFNDPLKSSILNKGAYKYIGGICNLGIGTSEEVFKCWNDNNFYQVPPSPPTPDEMCFWVKECELSTGYPQPGCHGCGGPGRIFPAPGEAPLPVADFTASSTVICVGQSITFSIINSNCVMAFSWMFEGATPSGSTLQNPTVTYITAGTYTVCLTVTNSTGSDTVIKVNYITVKDCYVGNKDVYSNTSVNPNRRAMPFTMPEDGVITSVAMYHLGGNASSSVIYGVYDGDGSPQNRLGVTPITAVNSTDGWQIINLIGPAFVSAGSTVWLAWVYENNPGIKYQTGIPGRYDAGIGWQGGMPDPFGGGSQANFIYSIYAPYTID